MKTSQLTEEILQSPHGILRSPPETASLLGAWPRHPQLLPQDSSDNRAGKPGTLDPVVFTAASLRAGEATIVPSPCVPKVQISPMSSGTGTSNTYLQHPMKQQFAVRKGSHAFA